MIRRLAALAAAAVLSLVLMACGNREGAGHTQELTADDDGNTVVTVEGTVLEVSLESNPSTGYSWRIETVDRELVEPIGAAQFNRSETGLAGAPGMAVFRFKTLKAGTSELALEYVRPDETDGEPAETFAVEVEATDGAEEHSEDEGTSGEGEGGGESGH